MTEKMETISKEALLKAREIGDAHLLLKALFAQTKYFKKVEQAADMLSMLEQIVALPIDTNQINYTAGRYYYFKAAALYRVGQFEAAIELVKKSVAIFKSAKLLGE